MLHSIRTSNMLSPDSCCALVAHTCAHLQKPVDKGTLRQFPLSGQCKTDKYCCSFVCVHCTYCGLMGASKSKKAKRKAKDNGMQIFGVTLGELIGWWSRRRDYCRIVPMVPQLGRCSALYDPKYLLFTCAIRKSGSTDGNRINKN